MSHYPTLSEMGVRSFDQIDRYSIQALDAKQTLKIYYCRPIDSSLPKSKKFVFNTGDAVLQQAVVELESLSGNPDDPSLHRDQLEQELLQFEEVMSSKLGELRRRLQSWGQPSK